MAIKGLSIPVFGKYNEMPDGNVVYTHGMINPHAVSYAISPESSDANPLYGDNQIIENDKQVFSSATLSLETDDLVQEVSEFILGAKVVKRTYGLDKTVSSLVFDDEQDSPALGFGIIEEHQNDDKTTYKAVILKKTIFNLPEDTATTRGQSIEWQTKTIEGSVQRSAEVNEFGNHPWKETADFAKESEAVEFLKYMLGVGVPDLLVITSAAGTTTGDTKITVTPEKGAGNSYRYKAAESVTVPKLGEDCSSFTSWDGTEEIKATKGNQILIVECDLENKAVKAGVVTAVVKEA
jgi:hypothetical protein